MKMQGSIGFSAFFVIANPLRGLAPRRVTDVTGVAIGILFNFLQKERIPTPVCAEDELREAQERLAWATGSE